MKFELYIGTHTSWAFATLGSDVEPHTQLFPYAFAELVLNQEKKGFQCVFKQ